MRRKATLDEEDGFGGEFGGEADQRRYATAMRCVHCLARFQKQRCRWMLDRQLINHAQRGAGQHWPIGKVGHHALERDLRPIKRPHALCDGAKCARRTPRRHRRRQRGSSHRGLVDVHSEEKCTPMNRLIDCLGLEVPTLVEG